MRSVLKSGAIRKLIFLFMAVAIGMSALLVHARVASACDFTGEMIKPRPESLAFTGKALEVRDDGQHGNDVYFEVYTLEQGNVKALVHVWTPNAAYSCGGYGFKAGELYEVITIDSKLYDSSNEAWINTVRPLSPEEVSEKEKLEGQSLLEDFQKRSDAAVSINAEDLIVSRPYDYFYTNKDNRVMVPLTEANMSRFGIEPALPDQNDDKVTLTYKGRAYTYRVGFNTVQIGEEIALMDTVLERVDGILFIPARQVADIIEASLTWDNKRKKLNIAF
ncbi:copper amine oxidase N-terminal domain-containing protein [Paenibacillus sacheonensis]|uniref:Copper amine oxidase-like N-terminal domain-containing protein n=1 Tax=Paenibacillus sacheonensis TaxID=742054 RepID=A0A7X5C1P5_9BACL|nr:copper amine oxidase N-terminal domain-containing protein [Paenibacillus sacheonensis]NBC70515.1 hypothetical protein [Paenibacillus sacheonensis]